MAPDDKPRLTEVDRAIDQFVEKMNGSELEPKPANELPAMLRRNESDEHGWYHWQIQRAQQIDWIDAFESKLPSRLPPSFRSLVTRYLYPAFAVGPVWLFANTGEALHDELRDKVFRDAWLCRVLLSHGHLQFAQPNPTDYDPVCFDTKRRTKAGEMPIVRIDHEAILCDSKIVVTAEVAESFLRLIELS